MDLIVDAAIVPSDSSKHRYQATVMVQLSNGTVKDLFSYFDDEISFQAIEFIGMEEPQALGLFLHRDSAYLRS